MKNKILMFMVMAVSPVVSMASDMLPAGGYYETFVSDCDATTMQRTLDNATADRRAVITVVKCAQPAPVVHADVCIDCAPIVERVVDRRVYVEETVQRYAPIVTYVPAGEYVRTRRVCNGCDM